MAVPVARLEGALQQTKSYMHMCMCMCMCMYPPPCAKPRAAMALSKLSGDEQRILFIQLCNVLEPRTAVYLSSASTVSCGRRCRRCYRS